MNLNLLAKTLGRGVEVAALTPYSKWQELLLTRETLRDVVQVSGETLVATYELLAVQELDESREHVIEVRILASDGYHQMAAYFYARPLGAEAAG